MNSGHIMKKKNSALFFDWAIITISTAVAYDGPKAWNSLPSNLQELMNTDTFLKQLTCLSSPMNDLRCKWRCEIMSCNVIAVRNNLHLNENNSFDSWNYFENSIQFIHLAIHSGWIKWQRVSKKQIYKIIIKAIESMYREKIKCDYYTDVDRTVQICVQMTRAWIQFSCTM